MHEAIAHTSLDKSDSRLNMGRLALDRSISRKGIPHVMKVFRSIGLFNTQYCPCLSTNIVKAYSVVRVRSTLHHDLNNRNRVDNNLDNHANDNRNA